MKTLVPILLTLIVLLSLQASTTAVPPSPGSVGSIDSVPVKLQTKNTVGNNSTSEVDGLVAIDSDIGYIKPINSYPDEPFATGFHAPQIDGIVYGHGGTSLPAGTVAEWADAHAQEVVLTATDGSQILGYLYTKQIRDTVYVALVVNAVPHDDIVETWLQYDRDGDDNLSTSDLRVTRIGPASTEKTLTPLQVEGFTGETWTDVAFEDPVVPADLQTASHGSGTMIETSLDLGTLDASLGRLPDQDPYFDFVGHSIGIRTSEQTYVLGDQHVIRDDRIIAVDGYARHLHVPAFTLLFPFDDLSVHHIELTQSVQRADNSLPVIRDKETLARVFVTHDNPQTTEVQVRLTGYALRAGSAVKLGTLDATHVAPAGALNRENESHSANFELPAEWTDARGLIVIARVSRQGYVDVATSDNVGGAFVSLIETQDPDVYYVRVNVGSESAPWRSTTTNVDAATSTIADTYPIADPTFIEIDGTALGSMQGADDSEIIGEMNRIAAGIVLAALLTGDPDIPFPDQVFGFTPDRAGTSDPPWGSTPGSMDSMASIGSVDGSAHNRLIMAHEINHNIGDGNWALHAGNGSAARLENGCGAGDDPEWQRLYPTNTYLHEVGWDPAVGIIPTEYPDFMSYCQIWEVTVPAWTGGDDPAQWISDYRWVRLTDRFQTWDGDPVHPDLRTASASTSASTEADAPTARIIHGYLYKDGSGELLPSFEQPGVVPESLRPSPVDDPQAYVEVRSGEQVERVPLAIDFDKAHQEAANATRWPFLFALPDDGTITGIELVDAETGDMLDSFEATNWTVTSTTFDLPDFDRGAAQTVGVFVTATVDPETTLYKRLLYSPDGKMYFPYGPTFVGDELPIQFEELPGGDQARFRVLVSDGVRTEAADSPTFNLSHAPPEVAIDRKQRWRTIPVEPVQPIGTDSTMAGEPADFSVETVNVASPVHIAVGQPLTLDATSEDEWGRSLPTSALTWQLTDIQGAPIQADTAVGPRFAHQFRAPGTYAVSVTATDPATGLTATDTIDVVVLSPPLPDAETFERFEQSFIEETSTPPAVSVITDWITEGERTTVVINVTDPDDAAHLVYIDWSNGTRTERILGNETLTYSIVYGDDGAFPVTVTALDDGLGVGINGTVIQVANVAPLVSLSSSDSVTLPGGVAIVTQVGRPITATAMATDPGSDDLTFNWNGSATTVYNDGIGPDPERSPDGTFPFTATDSRSVTFDAFGRHMLSISVSDDDGGNATTSVDVLVAGEAKDARSKGYWRHQLSGTGQTEYSASELIALLEFANAASATFSEVTPATTIEDASAIMSVGGRGLRDNAEAHLLAAWLNLAAGGVTWEQRIDTDGDGVIDTQVGDALMVADTVVADVNASHADLERAKDLAEAISTSDEVR